MINLGLERISRLLQHISRRCMQQQEFVPSWRAAHIAGTNGKGSVAAYLTALLSVSNEKNSHGQPLRVGRFTSPHFIDRWDCIQINNKPVTRDAFLTTEHQVKAIAKDVEKELQDEAQSLSTLTSNQDTKLTEFELLTATAFTMFSQFDPRPCDIAVIECGLGGRLDSTNTLPTDSIDVSVITRIGMDHLDILGGSLESIVREKCGIFRPGVSVIVDGDNTVEVLKMIQKNHQYINQDVSASSTYRQSGAQSLAQNVKLSALTNTLMPHQQANMAVALHAYIQLMGSSHRPVGADMIDLALEITTKSYPARLQVLQPGWLAKSDIKGLDNIDTTSVILDGAHNPQSAEVLRRFIDKFVEEKSGEQPQVVIWIIGLSSTKPPAEMLATMFANSSGMYENKIIFTSFGSVDGMPWVKATSPEILLDSARQQGLFSIVGCTNNIKEALGEVDVMLAENHMRAKKPIVVIAGSLYLASDFLRIVRPFD